MDFLFSGTASKFATFCDQTDEDRNEFVQKLKQNEVLNMDMESNVLASLTHHLGIKSAIVNVVVNSAAGELVSIAMSNIRGLSQK